MVKYFFLLPYYNMHFASMINALAKIDGTEVKAGLLHPGKKFRPGYDWDNLIDDSIYIKLFEQEQKLDKKFINQFDVLGVLGVLGSRDLYQFALNNLLFTHKPFFVFSEGLKKKSNLNKFIKRLTLSPINNKKIALFAIGMGAYEDYLSLGMSKWEVYRFGFSVNRPTSPTPIISTPHEGIKLIYIGSLIERKRVFDLVKAFKIIKEGNPEILITLDIYGTGILEEELKKYTESNQLHQYIHFKGLVQQDILYQKISNYDCLILPSQYDGWGAVVNEAMQNQLAVIVSEGVRARQIVEHGKNGFHYPTGNVEALANHIETLAKDTKLLNRFRKNSLDLIQDYFPETLAARLHTIAEAKVQQIQSPTYSTSLKALHL